jgi:hypothetical protein
MESATRVQRRLPCRRARWEVNTSVMKLAYYLNIGVEGATVLADALKVAIPGTASVKSREQSSRPATKGFGRLAEPASISMTMQSTDHAVPV